MKFFQRKSENTINKEIKFIFEIIRKNDGENFDRFYYGYIIDKFNKTKNEIFSKN